MGEFFFLCVFCDCDVVDCVYVGYGVIGFL